MTADPLDIEGLEKLLAAVDKADAAYAAAVGHDNRMLALDALSSRRGELARAVRRVLPRLLSLAREAEGMREALKTAGEALTRAIAEAGLSGEPQQWLRLASEEVRAALTPSGAASAAGDA